MNLSFTPDPRLTQTICCRYSLNIVVQNSNTNKKASFTHSSLMGAAAPSPGSGCVGQESVTMHVLLCRMH